jgi:hypothetical protein
MLSNSLAAEKKDYEEVSESKKGPRVSEYLLGKNQEENEENKDLFQAAKAGDMAAVMAALQKGGRPNFFCHPEDHKNSLHVAAEHGALEICQVRLHNIYM